MIRQDGEHVQTQLTEPDYLSYYADSAAALRQIEADLAEAARLRAEVQARQPLSFAAALERLRQAEDRPYIDIV